VSCEPQATHKGVVSIQKGGG